MATNWTPFRHDLIDDPAVMRMASVLSIPRQHVIGCLYCVWTWFDRHTVNGNAVGVTEVDIDALAAHGSFAKAMHLVGWLEVRSDGCSVPRFDKWMSQGAKRRALTAKRVESHRAEKRYTGVTDSVTKSVTGALPHYITTQDRTEELNSPPTPLSEARAELERVEPFRVAQRVFREVGVDPDVADRLSAKVRLTPDVARSLATRCAEAKPNNPTGWVIARLQEMKIVPKVPTG